MDRGRHSSSSSSSDEIKPVEKTSHGDENVTSSRRDFLKEEFKNHEKVEQLKQAWEEQIICNKSLTDHIIIDNRIKSIERLIDYRNILEEVIGGKQIANLSKQFNNSLHEKDFDKAGEHVDNLTAINDKFEKHLKKIGVTLAADSTSAHEPNKMMLKLDEEIGTLELKHVKRSRMARFREAFCLEPRKTMSERVNNEIRQFKNNMRFINEHIGYDNISAETNKIFIKATFSLIKDFKKYSDQARDRSKDRQSRREGEAGMRELNKIISERGQEVAKWSEIRKSQTQTQEDLKFVPEEYQSLLQNLTLRKFASARQAQGEIIEGYEQRQENPETRKSFEQAYSWFKGRLTELQAAKENTQKLNEITPSSEETKGLIEEWKQQATSYEYIRACFGKMDALANKKLGENVKKYSQYCEDTHTTIKSLYESEDFETAKTSVEEWQKVQKDFEQFLAGQGLLEKIEQGDNNTGGEIAGAASLGKKERNEDAYFIDKSCTYFGVFDGVGGNTGGHEASKIAKEFIQEKVKDFPDDISTERAEEVMSDILKKAHEKITENQVEKYHEMATTASVVKIMRDGTAIIGNVGDSRVYLLKKDSRSVEQLTFDNDLASMPSSKEDWNFQKKMANMTLFNKKLSPQEHEYISTRNQVGGVLGDTTNTVDPKIYTYKINPGDMLIITSDGVHDNLADGHIADCIIENNSDTKQAANALIQAAKQISDQYDQSKGKMQRSKPDDITAIVVKFPGEGIKNAETSERVTAQRQANTASTSKIQ